MEKMFAFLHTDRLAQERLSQWRVQIATCFLTQTFPCTILVEFCLARLYFCSKRKQDLRDRWELSSSLRSRQLRFTVTNSETCSVRITQTKLMLILKLIPRQRRFSCRTKLGKSLTQFRSFFSTSNSRQKNGYSNTTDRTLTLLVHITYFKSGLAARTIEDTRDKVCWTSSTSQALSVDRQARPQKQESTRLDSLPQAKHLPSASRSPL